MRIRNDRSFPRNRVVPAHFNKFYAKRFSPSKTRRGSSWEKKNAQKRASDTHVDKNEKSDNIVGTKVPQQIKRKQDAQKHKNHELTLKTGSIVLFILLICITGIYYIFHVFDKNILTT